MTLWRSHWYGQECKSLLKFRLFRDFPTAMQPKRKQIKVIYKCYKMSNNKSMKANIFMIVTEVKWKISNTLEERKKHNEPLCSHHPASIIINRSPTRNSKSCATSNPWVASPALPRSLGPAAAMAATDQALLLSLALEAAAAAADQAPLLNAGTQRTLLPHSWCCMCNLLLSGRPIRVSQLISIFLYTHTHSQSYFIYIPCILSACPNVHIRSAVANLSDSWTISGSQTTGWWLLH